MHLEHLYAERALRAGAVGYLRKTSPAEDILAAVTKAVRGEIALSDLTTTNLLRSAFSGERQVSSRYGNLSDRELEVFELLGRGMKTRAIAEALVISPRTVERHQAGIKQKLGIAHMTELRRIAAIWITELQAH